jgi:uncharacterized glyoxalase superfamily protein PhnB
MPVLKVNDVQATIAFFTGVLGFELSWHAPATDSGETAVVRAGDAVLMFSTGGHLGGTPAFTGTLYFNLDGLEPVDRLYERVRDRVSIVWPLEDMPYGTREFGLRDPNGYTLAFAEALDRECHRGAGQPD